MALSTREVLLVLRARDEATRVMGRVSSAMSRMDRNAMISNQRAIRQQSASMDMAQRALREQERGLTDLRRAGHDVEYVYRNQTLAAREAWMQGKITGRQYRESMLEAAKLRNSQLEQFRQARQGQEDLIRSTRRELGVMREQQAAAVDRIRQIHDEREAIKDRGRAMQANGIAMASLGASMTYFSAIGIKAYVSNIQKAMDYNTAMAGVRTQIDDTSISLADLNKLGKQVGREIPVAFEEIPPALWAIFSSVDVGLKDAGQLVRRFAKDAVAGQTDLATATKTNLAIMNAYNLKTSEMTDVSDTMFRLVQKGIGSYEEFGNVIGRAIPSAVRAGQSYKTVAAMLAFLTKNGLSAAMAATSSARALDAISKSKVAERLSDMGVQVKNAQGEFRELPAILNDINDKFKDMTAPERADALEALFKGAGGTIQARRFFDSYFKDADTFNKLTETMGNSAGVAQKKFEQMAQTPQAKLQQLKNNWEILRIELGENLLPIAMKIVDQVNNWIDAFNRLDPKTKKTIAYIGAAVLVFGLLLGIIVTIVGIIGIFAGTAAALGITFGTLAAIVGGVVLAIAGLGTILGVSIKDWDDVKAAAGKFKDKLEDIKGWVEKTFGQAIEDALDGIKEAFNQFTEDVKKAWQEFKDSVDWESVKSDFESVKNTIEENADEITSVLGVIGIVIASVVRTVGLQLRLFGALFGPVFTGMISGVTGVVRGVIEIFGGIISGIRGWFKILKGLFTGDWKTLWDGVTDIASGAASIIVGIWNISGGLLLRVIGGLIEGIINLFETLYDVLVGHSIVPDLVNRIVELFTGLPGRVLRGLGDIVGRIVGKFDEIKTSVTRKVSDLVRSVVNLFKDIPRQAYNALSAAPSKLMGRGMELVRGLISGIDRMKDDVTRAVQNLIDIARTGLNSISGLLGKAKDGYGAILDLNSASQAAGAFGRPISARDQKKLPKTVQKIFNMVRAEVVKDMGKKKPVLADIFDVAKPLIDQKLKKQSKKLSGKALKAFNKAKPKKQKSLLAAVQKATAKDLAKLQKISAQYQVVLDKLEDAKDKLDDLRQEKANFIESVRDDLMGFGGLGGLQKPTDVFGNEDDWTPSNISSQLGSKLTEIKTFGTNLQKLLDMGFGPDVYRQVIEMGIVDGAAFAAALITATPEEVGQIRGLVSQIKSSSDSIANAAGNQMYNAGIAAAEGLVKGLESQAKALEAAAEKLGLAIALSIKKALGIKSPSRVALDIATNFGVTLARGLWNQVAAVGAASDALAQAMFIDPNNAPTLPPVVGGPPGSAPGQNGGPTVQQDITVYTNEIDPRRNAAELGWELAARFGV